MHYLVLMAAFLPTGFALKCFQCNSAENSSCTRMDSIADRRQNSGFLKECQVPANKTAFCRKTITKVFERRHDRTVRSCGWIRAEEKEEGDTNLCTKRENDYVYKRSCECFTDQCNGTAANRVPNANLILWLVVLFAVVFVRNGIYYGAIASVQ